MKIIFSAIISLCYLCSFGQSVSDTTGLDGRLRAHINILASDSLDGRKMNTPGIIKAANYIGGVFESQGLLTIGDSYIKTAYDDMLHNVVALIKGTDAQLRDEVVVIGAHFDHIGQTSDGGICRGANDNASGTSVMMELARMLAKNPPRRSLVLVAFDGEEVGLIGSKQFISEWNSQDGKLMAMFNFDMAGSLNLHGELTIEGVASIEGCDSIARTIPTDGYKVRVKPYGLVWGNMTDTAAFLDQSVPAVYIYTFPRPSIHSVFDTPQKIDYNGMSKIILHAQSLIRSVVDLDKINANKPLITDFKKFSMKDTQGMAEMTKFNKEMQRQLKSDKPL